MTERLNWTDSFNRASLVAQLVKNLPAMQETLVLFLDQEDPLEKGKASHSSTLVWLAKSQTWLGNFHLHSFNKCLVLSGAGTGSTKINETPSLERMLKDLKIKNSFIYTERIKSKGQKLWTPHHVRKAILDTPTITELQPAPWEA